MRVCEGAWQEERKRGVETGPRMVAADVSGVGWGFRDFYFYTAGTGGRTVDTKTSIRGDARCAATRPQYWRNALLSLAGGGVRK